MATRIAKVPDPPQCDWGKKLGSNYRCTSIDTKATGTGYSFCEEHRVAYLIGTEAATAVHAGGAMVEGLGPDAPTVTYESGAKESHAPYSFTSIDPLALLQVAQIQRGGDDKYGKDNWRLLPVETHINHALSHLFGYLAGDSSDDHLGHAAVRTLFALACALRPDYHGQYDSGQGAPDAG